MLYFRKGGVCIPRNKITKDMILKAAFSILRDQGHGAVNARSIAGEVGCSVQPIYSYFENMDDLIGELFAYTRQFYSNYVEIHSDKKKYFTWSGRCHLRFAREENHLFVFLFMTKHTNILSFQEFYGQFAKADVESYIETAIGLNKEEAKKLYMNMMIYTHGIASMIVTGAAELSDQEIGNMIEFAFWGFLKEIRKEQL